MNETKAPIFTPFNIIAGVILAIGGYFTIMRFTGGLGAVTNLTDNNPFGIWIGFDVLCGVALAAGGYTISTIVYIFGMKEYHPVVRPAILTGFLGYFLVAVGLVFDVGRPWRMPYPFLVSHGYTSVMFEVAACVGLYLTVLFLEFVPSVFAWLKWTALHRLFIKMTLALTILGVVLSTLHQSSLGSMFLIAPDKIHPLWYSPYIPVYFFISSIIAGLSMVIFESTLSHNVFKNIISRGEHFNHDRIVVGLAKAASLMMFGYFGIKVLGVAHGNHWDLLDTPYGYWFLVEMLGFILLPCILYAVGARTENATLVKVTSVIAILGIVLNRFNISIIAFNWKLPAAERYFPSFGEIMISMMLVTIGILAFRWIVNRMPILTDDLEAAHRARADTHTAPAQAN